MLLRGRLNGCDVVGARVEAGRIGVGRGREVEVGQLVVEQEAEALEAADPAQPSGSSRRTCRCRATTRWCSCTRPCCPTCRPPRSASSSRPGRLKTSAAASRVPAARPAHSYGRGSPATGSAHRARPGRSAALRTADVVVGSSRPLVGTSTKSSSPIQTARSAKARRIASAITFSVLVAPKPKPWLASPSGKRSSIFSIWITVSAARRRRRPST